jgi:hypothetical protein
MERPCTDAACQGHALDRFFAKLTRTALKTTARPVRISQFGDSLVMGDDFAGTVRGRLQKAFGEGGHGVADVALAEVARPGDTQALDAAFDHPQPHQAVGHALLGQVDQHRQPAAVLEGLLQCGACGLHIGGRYAGIGGGGARILQCHRLAERQRIAVADQPFVRP